MCKGGRKRDQVQDCTPEMLGKTQMDCRDPMVFMVVEIINCKCMRCEDLLWRVEEEQNETFEVFNYDQVQKRMSTPLSKTKSELSRCNGD